MKPIVDGKRFDKGPSGRRSASGEAEDLGGYVHDDSTFTPDRGKCVNDGVSYRASHTKDGIRYPTGSAHNPFHKDAIKQPGGAKGKGRLSL